MAKLTDDHRRALRLLAARTATEALMLAHGFSIEMLTKLLSQRLVRADAHSMRAGERPITVVWMQITAAGRTAIAE